MSEDINDEDYTPEQGVPIPPAKVGSIPITKMEVGDSVEFPLAKRASLQSHAHILKIRDGKVFTIKKISADKARIWRTE